MSFVAAAPKDPGIPVFPLDTVLFPGGLLPLRIFEIRYLDMVRDCLRNNTGFVVCLHRGGDKTDDDAPNIYRTGTLGRIIDWEQLQDGLLGIMVQGEQRVHIQTTAYQMNRLLLADIRVLDEPDEVPLPSEFASLGELLERILSTLSGHYAALERRTDQASWVASRLCEILPIALPEKQRILETNDPLARLFYLRDAMMSTYT